jgi:hypothetical protein
MEFENQDHFSLASLGVPGGAAIDQVASGLASTIKNNAKTKSAKKSADAGQYWTLRPFLKNLIRIPQYILDQVSNQGITYYAVLQLPAQGVGANNTDIINALKQISGKGDILHADPTSQAAKSESQMTIGTTNAAGVTLPSTEPPSSTAKLPWTARLKDFVPYVIGAAVVAIILYFVLRKHK